MKRCQVSASMEHQIKIGHENMPLANEKYNDDSSKGSQAINELSIDEMREVIDHELTQQESKNSSTVKLIGLNLKTIPPEDIKLLANAERLSLRKNNITYLPENFSELKNLRYLDLHSNGLREIPVELLNCQKLEILDISSNKISQLPEEFPSVFSTRLKVISLKNNRLTSIWKLSPILQLNHIKVLEIEGNPIPKEELDQVLSYVPNQQNLPKDEYWAIAIPRFLNNHPKMKVQSLESKLSRAAKRMGFVNTIPVTDEQLNDSSISSAAISEHINNVTIAKENFTDTNMNTPNVLSSNDLYNHTKYNDYFKRLSILPEEVNQEQHKVSHTDLVVACRKLLFSFTECQQAIRKITSLCKEKSIAVNVVSLLYSVRSHIDNLVEILEQSDNQEISNDQPLITLCMTIISIFKQIIALLQKNFKAFFEEDDLCFIRMFFMSLVCSYTEMYNAWSFITPQETLLLHKKSASNNSNKIQPESDGHPAIIRSKSEANSRTDHVGLSRKPTLTNVSKPDIAGVQLSNEEKTRYHDAVSDQESSVEHNESGIPKVARSRSNTIQGRGTGSLLNVNGSKSNIITSPNGVSQLRTQGQLPTHAVATTNITQEQGSSDKHKMNISNLAKTADNRGGNFKNPPDEKQINNELQNGNVSLTAPKLKQVQQPPLTEKGGISTPTGTDVDIDQQLHETLGTVVKMVTMVYNQLTSEISKVALASSTGHQVLTDTLATKIKDLTDTCRQLLQLSQVLGERLRLLTGDGITAEKYSTTSEKLKTWESINAFLKAIISILANAKTLMADLPSLNEVRPQLASLAKITKDVTVILDLSSYKAVSVAAANQEALQHSNNNSETKSGDSKSPVNESAISGDHSHTDIANVPLFTPQAASAYMRDPFDQQ